MAVNAATITIPKTKICLFDAYTGCSFRPIRCTCVEANKRLESLIFGKFPSRRADTRKLPKTPFEEERGKSNGVWNAPIVHQELSNYGHSAWKLDGLLSLAASNLMGWASNLGSHTCKLK